MTRELRVSTELSLPIDAVTQTFVIFGKRGSGKSNTGVVLAEEMHRAGGQIILKAGARRMLEILVAEYPGRVSRADLAERAGVVPGGTFSSYLSALRRTGLLDESGAELGAGEALFLGGGR